MNILICVKWSTEKPCRKLSPLVAQVATVIIKLVFKVKVQSLKITCQHENDLEHVFTNHVMGEPDIGDMREIVIKVNLHCESL